MTLQTRIRLANVERAAQRRAEREEQVARLYQHGYKAPREPGMAWDAIQVISALVGSLLVLVLALQWALS